MISTPVLPPAPAPTPAPAETVHVVAKGEALSGIAAKHGTTYQVLAAYNGIANPNVIFVGQRIKIPGKAVSAPAAPAVSATAKTYTVVAGDRLSGIASRFGTSYKILASINGIADPNRIYPGQTIKLP